MKAYFTSIEDLARFVAQLSKEGVEFEVSETSAAGRYVVVIIAKEG